MSNFDQFADALESEIAMRFDRFYREFRRSFALWIFSQIVFRSPVWENKPTDPPSLQRPGGTFRGAWNLALGNTSRTRTPGQLDPTGNLAVSQASTRLDSNPLNTADITISNASVYGGVLEFGLFPNPPSGGTGRTRDGFSTQLIDGPSASPPYGMVRTTLQDAPDAARGIALELANQILRGTGIA